MYEKSSSQFPGSKQGYTLAIYMVLWEYKHGELQSALELKYKAQTNDIKEQCEKIGGDRGRDIWRHPEGSFAKWLIF